MSNPSDQPKQDKAGKKCPECKGHKADPNDLMVCFKCRGRGYITDIMMDAEEVCPECQGQKVNWGMNKPNEPCLSCQPVEPTNTDAELKGMLTRFWAEAQNGRASTAYPEAIAFILAYTRRYHIAGLEELRTIAFKATTEDGKKILVIDDDDVLAAIEAEEKKTNE